MNNRLKAELWEIQVILYLILAQMIELEWVKWLIWLWCIITFVSAIRLLNKAKKDGENHE